MKREALSWSIIWGFSLSGVGFATVSIFGFIYGREVVAWLTMGVLLSALIVLKVPARVFLNAFLTGFFSGTIATFLQGLFIEIYFKNNPGYEDVELPIDLSPRLFTLLFSPVNGLWFGCFVGVIALAASWFRGRRTARKSV